MKNIVVRLAVIGVFIVGGLIFRDRLSSSAGDLQVGDCFEQPTTGVSVKDVQHQPCSEPHTGEVFLVVDHPAGDEPLTSDSQMTDFVRSTCLPAYFAYVGPNDAATIEVGFFYPTSEGWKNGDREVTCYLYPVDGTPLTKSLKAA